MEKNNKRYFIGSDNDGHSYLIEADRRREWNAWIDKFNENEEYADDCPSFAISINTHHCYIEFSDPINVATGENYE